MASPRDDDLGIYEPPETPAPPAVKVLELDPYADERQPRAIMKCSLPPHTGTMSFSSYEEYDSHYNKAHTNRCIECRKNFPSEHLLGVHIEEFHDSFVAVQRERGERTYSCFVEGCERKCRTHQKRRMHLIDKHMYPKNYFFAITKEGIDGRRSLLVDSHRRRSSSNAHGSPKITKDARRRSSILGNSGLPSTQNQNPELRLPSPKGTERNDAEDTNMADLTSAMSALKFVPPTLRFGRSGRAGLAKK